MTMTDPLLAICFTVTIDGMSLGNWTEVSLGGIEVDLQTREEGGNQLFVHQLPGRMKHDNIKLTRLMGDQTALVAAFFATMASGVKPTTAEIVALGRNYEPVATFTYFGVVPKKWSLPTFSVDSNKALTESLEFAHHGFTTS
jgi:phage tail-like protein